jgi:hypothetical protein
MCGEHALKRAAFVKACGKVGAAGNLIFGFSQRSFVL